MDDVELMRLFEAAHEAGVKLEMHEGIGLWEPLPFPAETLARTKIIHSVSSPNPAKCVPLCLFDMAIQFDERSVRRPDISIYLSHRPPKPTYEATRKLPEAVIEVVSSGSEVKDMELSPPFYLLHGVKDVVVFDPRTGSVAHFRRDGRKHLTSPVEIALECGCVVTV